MSTNPRVTIMIATHNRVSELLKTLASCRALVGPEREVLVVDDASTDGTYDLIRKNFPGVDLLRNEANCGSIASRNDILRRAQGDYIVALDDDSRFVDADACQRIVSRMDDEPDLGIISFQVIGPEHPATLEPSGRAGGEWHCSSFACCGAAIRRRMLERTGLFPEFFYHAYEEPDLAILRLGCRIPRAAVERDYRLSRVFPAQPAGTADASSARPQRGVQRGDALSMALGHSRLAGKTIRTGPIRRAERLVAPRAAHLGRVPVAVAAGVGGPSSGQL